MGFADFLARARRQAPAPELVTRVTRDPLPTGYAVDVPKTAEFRLFQGAVTRVTPNLSHAVGDPWLAPANDLTLLILTTETDDEPPPLPLVQGLSDAEWLDAMAEALTANSVDRSTSPEASMAYFRDVALNHLAATDDPLARGLLLGFERYGRSSQHVQTEGQPHV